MSIEQGFFIFAALCNCAAAVMNLYVTRRNRRGFLKMRDAFTKAVAFAAFMSTKESGAPLEVRKLAKAALPPGAEVEISAIVNGSPTLH